MITPNKGQERIIQEGLNFLFNSSEQVFQIQGGPGTGKSFTLFELLRRARIPLDRVLPMAFTGAAAIVMRRKGFLTATTIHSGLFKPVMGYAKDENGNIIMNTYINRPVSEMQFVPKDIDDYDVFVIDEAYMVPKAMKRAIEARGKKIIVAGDPDQLPPVNDEPAYLVDGKIHILDEVMRQASYSSIPYLADRLKRGLPIHKGFYGDVLVIEENELTDDMLRGSQDILCCKNVTREKYNKHIRWLYGFKSDLPQYGEKVVCRKSNKAFVVDNINLANGLSGRVVNRPDPCEFGKDVFVMNFKADGMNSVFNNLLVDYDYFTAPFGMKQAKKNDRYARGEKFDFAYCKTTHLAQGSQSSHGIYIQEYLSPEINNKLNYTGLTRFERGAIYVLPSKKRYR